MKITCTQCGFERTIREATLPPRAVFATCPKCKHRFRFREVSPPPASDQPKTATVAQTPDMPQPDVSETPPGFSKKEQHDDLWAELEAFGTDEDGFCQGETCVLPHWEKAENHYARAFFQTFMDVVSDPKHFFTTLAVGAGLLKPLLFFLILGEAVSLSWILWEFLGILPPSPLTENLGQGLQPALNLILYPLQVTALFFLSAGMTHFFLHLFKADAKGFEGTFRALTYSAAPILLAVIPYIGFPLAMIAICIYQFLGLRHVHGASNKQIAAVLTLSVLLALIVSLLLVANGWTL